MEEEEGGGGGKESGRRRERDTSPSAYSQSSTGLEWDPSADVGSSSSPYTTSSSDKKTRKEFTGSEEGMLETVQETRPKISRSKSYDWGSTVGTAGTESSSWKGQLSEKESMIHVEIEQKLRKNVELKSMGVQTSLVDEGGKKNNNDTSSQCSSIYHSTPTEKMIVKKKEAGGRGEGKVEREREQRRRDRERSPPQPFQVASRRSSHKHHHASHIRGPGHGYHHGRHHEVSSVVQGHKGKKNEMTSSSELSPPCFLIDKIASSTNTKDKDDVISAIEIHRDYHVKKVRHELKQLEKLNHLLSKKLNTKRVHQSSSSTEAEVRHKPPRSKAVVQQDSRQETSSTVMSESPVSARDAPSGSFKTVSSVLLREANRSSTQEARDTLEKKLDELMDAFSIIAGMLLDKEKDRESEKENIEPEQKTQESKQQQPVPHKKEIVKPPIAYFVPFPVDEGKYVFRKQDIEDNGMNQRPPPIRSESRTISRQGQEQEQQVSLPQSGPASISDEFDEDIENKDPSIKDVENKDGELKDIEVQGEALKGALSKEDITRLTLQALFESRCPNFLNRLRQREAILARIKTEREIRTEKKREWIRLYGKGVRSLSELETILPPKGPRLMSTKEMRDLTRRHYKTLPEVQERKIQKKVEEEKKTNRIMSQVFAQQLRKGVLRGEVNFQHNHSVLRK